VTTTRQEEFRRNPRLEQLLQELNSLLGPLEEEVRQSYRMPRYPVVFVVGVPRCGSTLVLQWLAHSGRFAYPTNLLSRFYGAPSIGAKIQLLLTAPEYNFKDEILDFSGGISFSSNLGKTQGALAPNEFWYFWRRFIPNTEPQYLDQETLSQVRSVEFVSELAALESVLGKPWAMKGLILELNIPFLSSILDKALFLFVRRDPFHNIQSLLESRVRYYGDRRAWYSIKPQEYEMLKNLDPFDQVAGQVYFTNRGIQKGLEQIDTARTVVVDYEDFCTNPKLTFDQILTRFHQQGVHFSWDYEGPRQFSSANKVRLSKRDCTRIVASYKRWSGLEIKPSQPEQHAGDE
jgi:hypothetical protein